MTQAYTLSFAVGQVRNKTRVQHVAKSQAGNKNKLFIHAVLLLSLLLLLWLLLVDVCIFI